MLNASNITVSYETKVVLRGLDLDINAGELTAVIGPNGAGKTTLVRVLNGSVDVTGGSAVLDGTPINELARPQIAKKISVVAQENETKFPMTVREFVLAGRFAHGGAFGWESEADIKAAESCLEECGLTGAAERLMNELSGGERQRVLLARAFATEAALLLLDEPTNNLDLANQALMLRVVKERCEKCGSAAVVVTHDLNLVAAFADRVVVLVDGKVESEGPPEEILTEERISRVFELSVLTDINPRSGKLRITPDYTGRPGL
ncbi:MAG: ABC transporter ATP-binding protein [Pyrinomonadaceae bacterium]|nr:ABC transporter ATP-binding protein [Pyrinomonadaceae bacterium]